MKMIDYVGNLKAIYDPKLSEAHALAVIVSTVLGCYWTMRSPACHESVYARFVTMRDTIAAGLVCNGRRRPIARARVTLQRVWSICWISDATFFRLEKIDYNTCGRSVPRRKVAWKQSRSIGNASRSVAAEWRLRRHQGVPVME